MTTNEKYDLTWHNHVDNLANEVKQDDSFFDVTLATNGGFVKAHRLILAASSPLFKNTLLGMRHIQDPILYMRGVEQEDLRMIIGFIYEGQVQVAQEHMEALLKVAKDLQIKGLTEDTESSPIMESDAPPSKKRKIASGSIKSEDLAQDDNAPVEEEKEQLGLAPMTDGRVTCLRCGKILSKMGNARMHFKNMHENNKADKNIKCKLCEKKFGVKQYMHRHMVVAHGISPKLFKANIVPKFKPDPEEDDSEVSFL
jgi:DNA-directed RNA polymerase subunit RPC12/RpoP